MDTNIAHSHIILYDDNRKELGTLYLSIKKLAKPVSKEFSWKFGKMYIHMAIEMSQSKTALPEAIMTFTKEDITGLCIFNVPENIIETGISFILNQYQPDYYCFFSKVPNEEQKEIYQIFLVSKEGKTEEAIGYNVTRPGGTIQIEERIVPIEKLKTNRFAISVSNSKSNIQFGKTPDNIASFDSLEMNNIDGRFN